MGLGDLLDRRRARARLLSGKVAVIHSRGYAVPSGLGGRALHDGHRGARVLRKLFADGLLYRGSVLAPKAASFDQLSAFHGAEYLEACWRPERLGPIFGASPSELPIDELLDSARAAVGGTVLGARLSRLAAREVINLGGGFHHAEPDQGGGYCVFNDVGVAIRLLRQDGFGGRIAVVDLDLHHGNGTARGFEADESVFTFSMHRVGLARIVKTANLDVTLPAHLDDDGYLALLDEHLPRVLDSHGAELIFYVAGSDVVAGDAIGDLSLTEAGVARRDDHVLSCAAKRSAPIVATLAGGYGEHAWRCAYRLARRVLTGQLFTGEVIDPTVTWYREASSRLAPHDLQGGEDASWEMSEAELGAQLGSQRSPAGLFLGYYSRTGLERALEHYGLLGRLRRRGFHDLRVELDPADRARQTVRVYGRKGGPAEHVLIELEAGLRELKEAPDDPDKPLRFLSVEWLTMSDPSADFAPGRTRLPLQKHPGLGVAREVMHVLDRACERLGLDGIVQSAAHFHGAVLLGTLGALFFDPVREGKFRSLRRSLADLRLADATALVEQGRVVELPEGRPFRWEGADQIVPVSRRAVALFAREAWLIAVSAAEKASSYRLADPADAAPLVGVGLAR